MPRLHCCLRLNVVLMLLKLSVSSRPHLFKISPSSWGSFIKGILGLICET
ncbi:hypothetical protein M758_4G129600 [Ceratodon purpureus]|nr:hypothetical protein M758_4G129600 [Ceratodon purpureus]